MSDLGYVDVGYVISPCFNFFTCENGDNNAYFRGLLYWLNEKLYLKAQHKGWPTASAVNMLDSSPCRKGTSLRHHLKKKKGKI